MEKSRKNKGSLATFFIIVAVLIGLVAGTFQTIRSHLNLGLDLQGGFEILYQVSPLNGEDSSSIDMNAVSRSISKRVNVLGVSEPVIAVEGDDRIRVQLAGVSDQENARKMIGTTANLTFRDVDDNELADASILQEGGASLAYQDGKPVVSLKIADSSKFGEITNTISKKTSGTNIMVIWLDYEDGDSYAAEAAKAAKGEEPKYISAATVSSTISGDCIISGNFTEAEATTLAELINSGSLPVKMTEISSNVISAEYGEDALAQTEVAGLIGVAAVILFMIFVYKVPGILASIMLVFYIWAVFGLYALMGAVFTLSGIGALVLGVGMTVDANIINYERIRQELYKGRSVRNAVKEGQQLSYSAVFDAQFTTLIAALIMYIWGNGTVKGFATMLIITVVLTLVLNVGFSKLLLNLVVNSGALDEKPKAFGVKPEQIPDVRKGEKQFYTGTHAYDYVGKAKYFNRVSLTIFAIALVMGIVNAARDSGFFNLGIDFSSGTKLTVTSNETIQISDVQTEMESLGYDSFSYQKAGDSTVYATTKQSLSTDDLSTIKSAFKEIYGIEPGDNVVTPIVGRDLVHNAVILTLVAWVAMMCYVAFRYQWDYALSCIVALIHDVFMVLAVFCILRMEVNIELISVLLTIIGYSINNSIVVFDRVRERMKEVDGKKMHEPEYTALVNKALDQTIRMSLNSSITTILPVIALLLFGSKAIGTFVWAMFIGMIAGTISSIFVAPMMWRYFRLHRKPKEKKKKTVKKEALDEYTFKGINA